MQRQLHPHGLQRGQARPELDPAHARACSSAVLEWIPTLGGRPDERLPRRAGDRQRRRDRRAASAGASRGRRTAPTSSSTCASRRRSRWRTRAGEVLELGAVARRALPRLRDRGRGLRDRARRGDRRGPPARRRDRRGARGGLRRAARARRDALVLGRVGADALRDPDGQLRHVDRPAGRRARREPRDRRARADGGGLRPAPRRRVCGVA